MSEKRKNHRRRCLVPIEGKEDGPFNQTTTIDLSSSGIGLISKSPVSLDQEIPIELDLADDQNPVLVIGKVQWIKPLADSNNYRIGLSFKEVLQGSKSREIPVERFPLILSGLFQDRVSARPRKAAFQTLALVCAPPLD